MSRLVFPHSGLNALSALHPTFSSAQLGISALETSFSREVCNGRSLASMMAGGLAFKMGRLAALESFSSLALMRNTFTAPLFRTLAFASALAGEVTVFRGVNQILSSEIISPEQSFLNPQSWMATFVDFLALKTMSPFGARNILFSHLAQDAAVVTGHHIDSALGFTPEAEGSLAQQFIHAEAMNLQMSAGMKLAGFFTGESLRRVEAHLDARSSSHVLSRRSEGQSALLQNMSAGGLDGIAPVQRGSGLRKQRLKKLRQAAASFDVKAVVSEWKIPSVVLGTNIEAPTVRFRDVWRDFKERHEIKPRVLSAKLATLGIELHHSTIDNYARLADAPVDPRFLRGIHLVYGENYLDLVYLAGRHLLESPEARALAVTAHGPLLIHQKWIAGHLNRLVGLGRAANSLQYQILAAQFKAKNLRTPEEMVAGSDVTEKQLTNYLRGYNQPEPNVIPALARVLNLSIEEVIEGINADRDLIAHLDSLRMKRGIYFFNNGQANDDDLLREFSGLGLKNVKTDVSVYLRYKLWRAHKESAGGTISTFQRSLSWGKDETYFCVHLSGQTPFRVDYLGDWVEMLRRMDLDPASLLEPFAQKMGLRVGGFKWELHFALGEKTFQAFADDAGTSLDVLRTFCEDPEAAQGIRFPTALRILLAIDPPHRPKVLRSMGLPDLRIAFPEMFDAKNPRMVLTLKDLENAHRFSLPAALKEALCSQNVGLGRLAEIIDMPVETLGNYAKRSSITPRPRRISKMAPVLGVSDKAWLIHFHPEILFILDLENPETGKTFRLHSSQVAALFSQRGVFQPSYERAVGVRCIDVVPRLAEIANKIGRGKNRSESSLSMNEEQDLYFIWRYSESQSEQRAAEEILLNAYRGYISKVTRITLSQYNLNIGEYFDLALSEAHYGFRRALEGFRSELGYRFMSYIIHKRNWIQHEVARWCEKQVTTRKRESLILNASAFDDSSESLIDQIAHPQHTETAALASDPALPRALMVLDDWFETQTHPQFYRAVFAGRFVGDRTLEEVAIEHELTRETARTVESQIRKKAREVFADFQED